MEHFIYSLRDEISIVKELPSEYSWSSREYYATGIRATRIKTAPVHASPNWYVGSVLPVLQRLVISSNPIYFVEICCLNFLTDKLPLRFLPSISGISFKTYYNDFMRSYNLKYTTIKKIFSSFINNNY